MSPDPTWMAKLRAARAAALAALTPEEMAERTLSDGGTCRCSDPTRSATPKC